MLPRRKRRDQWRQTKKGTWTISLGHRGQRVRLFQNSKDGIFYREVHLPGGRKDRRSLGTREKTEAERVGRQLLAALLTCDAPQPNAPVQLGELVRAFITESPMFLDNAQSTKADAKIRASILAAVIGERRDVRTLTENDVRQYEARRRAGGIRYGAGKVTEAVRQRSVQADIKLLKSRC
jgi:hypothetical protein